MLRPFTTSRSPRHALRLRAEELHALPFRKAGDEQVRGAADEVEAALAHCRKRGLDRHHQLERDVEPLAFEEAELDRCNRGEVGIRDQVGNCEFHRLIFSL
jgi:hypothetical protein